MPQYEQYDDETPSFDGLVICLTCWQDEGFHFGWCPEKNPLTLDDESDIYNETIDEEVEEMEDE